MIDRGELIVYYDKLLPALLSLMDPQEPEKTSNVFQTLLLMFRNLNGDDIRDHISIIRKYYGPLFGHKMPFVRQFACESYCYLLRHMSSSKKVEIKSASSVSKLAREQGNEQVKELLVILKAVSRKESISEPMILGISSLLFESIRGVGGQARRNGIDIFKALLDVLVGKKSLNKAGGQPSQSFVDIMYELQYCLAECALDNPSSVERSTRRRALRSSLRFATASTACTRAARSLISTC